MDQFAQQLVNGLTLGSLYALIAVGYTVVYGIVQAHGGDIEVTSVPGRETLFRVTLPVRGESASAEA